MAEPPDAEHGAEHAVAVQVTAYRMIPSAELPMCGCRMQSLTVLCCCCRF
jgi:hypothetical protein